MKRTIGLLLALVMLLSLTACGMEPESSEPETSTGAAPTEASEAPVTEAPTEAPKTVYAMENDAIVDNDSCAFTVTKVTSDQVYGMALEVLCENKTDKTLMFSWDMVSVCGIMYDPFWAQEVAPNEQAASTIYIDMLTLAEYGIPSVDEITFHLNIFDNENWRDEAFVIDEFTIYPTGLTAGTVTYPERQSKEGETVIVDNENLTFIIESVDSADPWQYTLQCYLENKTDKNVMISWDMVSVNGCSIDTAWAVTATAGKAAYSTISFYTSELEENGIEVVEDIEFTMIVSDYDDWNANYILDSVYTYHP